MDFILILLFLIYIVSPIPLLVLFIVAQRKANRRKRELEAQQIENRKSEELYRQYVNQLQRQVKSLDPQADIGFIPEKDSSTSAQMQPASAAPSPSVGPHPTPVPTPVAPVAQPTVPQPVAPAPQFYAQPAVPQSVAPIMAAQTQATPATQIPAPIAQPQTAPAPQIYAQPQTVQAAPVAQPQFAPVAQPAAPQVQTNVSPVPQYTAPAAQYAAQPKADHSHTNLILITGVILLLLASVGFISATWSNLGIGVRALCLFSFSAIFLGAGILARAKFRLNSTSIAFYSIGSAALPITIFGGSAFALFGSHFGIDIPQIYNTSLLAFTALLILMVFGSIFFRSRVFAMGALTCLSLDVFTLTLMYEYPYSLDVLLIAVFASAMTLLTPIFQKIPEESMFRPFAKVFEIYAIINLYVMTLIAITISRYDLWSGLFLVGLAAVFLLATILRRKTGLLALPSIILILVGAVQILQPGGDLGKIIIWMIAVGVTFIALHMVLKDRKILGTVMFVFGLVFLIGSTFPTFFYTMMAQGWAFALMTLVPAAVLIFLSIKKKAAIISAAAILPVFTLFWQLISRVFCLILGYTRVEFFDFRFFGFPGDTGNLPDEYILLAGLIVAGVMYFLFSYIPHHRFFTSTGNIMLFHFFVYFGFAYVAEMKKLLLPALLFSVGFAILSLINACRNDRLNVRDLSVEKMPRSITANRCFYGAIWPVFLPWFFELYSRQNSWLTDFVALLAMILCCFGYLIYRVTQKGAYAWAFETSTTTAQPQRKSFTPGTTLSVYLGSVAVVVLLFSMIDMDTKYFLENYPVCYVIKHLIVLLVPAFLFFVAFREIRKDPENARHSAGVFLWTLSGLISFAVLLPYVRSVFRGELEDSFYTSVQFILPLLAVVILGILAVKLRKTDLAEATSVQKALFYFAMGISALTVIFRFSGLPHDAVPVLPILMGLQMIAFIVLFWKNTRTVISVLGVSLPATLICWNILATGRYYFKRIDGIPTALQVLVYLLPVVVYCGILLARKKTPVSRQHMFWAALASQLSVFIMIPGLTRSANVKLENLANTYDRVTEGANFLDKLFRSSPISFAQSHYAVIGLLGFLLIEVCYLILNKISEKRRRAVALILVTLSTVFWMPMCGYPSVAHLIEQFYLVPGAVFIALLTWIFPDRKKQELTSGGTSQPYTGLEIIRLIYSCLTMAILAVIALSCDDVFSLIFFGVVSFAILVIAYFLKKKAYIILGAVCILGMLAYIANRIWGNMAWWIYLFVTGATLITIAVRNEIRKRKN